MLTREQFEALPKEQQDALIARMQEVEKKDAVLASEEKGLPQLTMPEFKAAIEKVAQDYIKSMTPVDKKYFAFPGIGKEGLDDLRPEAKFSKTIRFLKAMATGEVSTLRTMHDEVRVKANLSEGTTTAGGFLVPEEFKAEILRLAPLYGVIRQNCRIIPMLYDTIRIPAAGTTDQSAIWTNEAAAIKQTNPNFREVQLTINKLAAIPKVTNELLNDANVDVINYLSGLIAWAFAKEEDNQAFNGTGSPFVGCLTATGVPTSPHASGTGFVCLSYQDLVYATGNLYTNAMANSKWYFHRSMVAHLRGLITTAGAPILGMLGSNDLFGYPVVSTEILPGKYSSTVSTDATPYAVFGDLRMGVAMGERGSITMKISDQATVDSDNLFEKDMAALRVIERVALGVLLPSSFTVLVS